ncbi:MAG: D-amino acid aminotransferase [Gammaproteobacteria bacterium]|nr:D-amino acid aminotransferase [Gammaproteobacteria bacterium]MCW8987318.1 D-amino acid aminotransferase [Gammaproteobacteria bacterium]MCW9032415.1 D-amino acid aminotransferase [Gammaproteobacteria bacterium]
MSSQLVYLNGEYLPLNEARVSVLDRGFIFGDGVYEVIPAYGSKVLRFEHHMQRLQNSLDAVRIVNPLVNKQWQDIIDKLITNTDSQDQYIYLHITRGVASRDHRFPDETKPTVFVMSSVLHPVDEKLLANGVAAVTLDDIRWQYCNIKAIALLPNILLRQQAIDKGAMEAILIRDGNMTEGAASNVFIVTHGIIKTPPKDNKLLPGITRDLVVELAKTHNMPIEETAISEKEFLTADEIWLTSSTKEILPVTRINEQQVGNGKPGAVWQDMFQKYQDYKEILRG